jgi:hypothetical protein
LWGKRETYGTFVRKTEGKYLPGRTWLRLEDKITMTMGTSLTGFRMGTNDRLV